MSFLNVGSLLKVFANSGEIETLLSESKSIASNAVALKAAVQDDLKQLSDGTLTAANVDTLKAAEALIKDVGDVAVALGTLSGYAPLSAIGAALSAV